MRARATRGPVSLCPRVSERVSDAHTGWYKTSGSAELALPYGAYALATVTLSRVFCFIVTIPIFSPRACLSPARDSGLRA